MAAAKALSALANQRFLRFGIGAGGAVVTERVLSAAAGVDESMYSWIAGTTAGGAVWGVIGKLSVSCAPFFTQDHCVYRRGDGTWWRCWPHGWSFNPGCVLPCH